MMKFAPVKLAITGLGVAVLATSLGCNRDDPDVAGLTTDEILKAKLTGAVLDDPLENAGVCVDLNRNYICDADEDTTTSNSAGNFKLYSAYDTSALLSVGETDKTKYVGGDFISDTIVNVAPPKSKTISPFSSLIQIGVEQNVFNNLTEANQRVATVFNLNTATDFANYNYAALNTTEAQKSRIAARVVQQTINRNYPTASIVNGSGDMDVDPSTINKNVFDAAVRSVLGTNTSSPTLDSINSLVDTSINIAQANGGNAGDVRFDDDGLLNITVGTTSIISAGLQTGGTVSGAIPTVGSVTVPSLQEIQEIVNEVVQNNTGGATADADADGVPNSSDNCPATANADQADADQDGVGDVCEIDFDLDGIIDDDDNCPTIANADQADADNDGLGDVCDSTPSGGSGGSGGTGGSAN